jgi:hypothetical protein
MNRSMHILFPKRVVVGVGTLKLILRRGERAGTLGCDARLGSRQPSIPETRSSRRRTCLSSLWTRFSNAVAAVT